MFVKEYYNEFGENCPFKRANMGIDKKELEDQYELEIKKDIPLLTRFFKVSIREQMEYEPFTPQEIEKLKYLDHYYDIPKINFMYTSGHSMTRYNLYSTAIKYGNITILEWLKENNIPFDKEAYCIATEHRDLETVKWLYENDYEWNHNVLFTAINCGKVDIADWLFEVDYPYQHLGCILIDLAAHRGDIKTVKWLIRRKCDWSSTPFNGAIKKGDLNMMKVLKESNLPLCNSVMGLSPPILENIKWLKSQGFPFFPAVMDKAIKAKNIELIDYLLDNGLEWKSSFFSTAVGTDDMSMVEYLHNKGCSFDSDSFLCAVECGNIRIMEWLHERKCSTNDEAYSIAAENNDLEVMSWLLKNKYTYNIYTIIPHAKRNKRMQKWIKENMGYDKWTSLQ